MLGTTQLATAAPLVVEWSAPACASQPAFLRQVRDALGREAESALEHELRVTVRIAQNAHKTGYVLQLELAGGTRALETPTCDEAVAAAAAVVALAIDPNALAPAPPAAPAPEAPPPTPPAPVARMQPYVAVRGGVSVAEVPAAAPVLGGALGLRWRGFAGQAEGFWVASRTERLAGETEKGGEIGLAGGGLAACYSPLRGSWRLTGCLAVQAGAWRSRGVAVQNPEQHTALWLAVLGRVGAGVSLGRGLGLSIDGELVVPARRPLFKLEDLGSVYRPSALGARVSAGVELGF